MKTETFRKNYELTKSTKGVRAVSKGSQGFPEVRTADNEIFDISKVYFFFDKSSQKIQQTTGLRRVDSTNLGAMGLKVVAISELRANRDAALSDGQAFFHKSIEALEESINSFEQQKESVSPF